MSAAFDTVDHRLLLDRLRQSHGIDNTVIKWITSYLSNRTQTVVVNNIHSSTQRVERGVPQGSVLGPMLFLLYTVEVQEIITSFGLRAHIYADDTQLYFHARPDEADRLAPQILACIAAIGQWLSSNRLKLNPEKTEFIWLASPYHLRNIRQAALDVGGVSIAPSATVRDLGVVFDNTLNLNTHVSNTVKSCFFQLRQLKYIRKSLSKCNVKTLLHAFVTSRIDYCNSLLAGQPDCLIDRLQSVLNAAARLYAGVSKRSHVSNILCHELHWLKVPQRINFKICTLVHRCLHGNAPSYLAEYCVPLCDTGTCLSRNRSSAKGDLLVPRTKTKTYGSRSFSVVGPSYWNALPPNLKTELPYDTFMSKLKTHLFTASYNANQLLI
jgi:hypothetical protein